jgi:hypothetical protein
MNLRLLIFLLVLSAGIILAGAWRLYAVYRRRRRWKMLTTSHASLQIARERIASEVPPLNEE